MIALPGASAMPVPEAFRSSRIVPSPLMLLTVTVYVLPLTWVTEAMVPAAVPVAVSAKSEASTPVTFSANVTA